MLKILFDKPIYKPKEEIAQIAEQENNMWYERTLNYLENHGYGFAIQVKKILMLSNPKTLAWMIKNHFTPPQSYKFLTKQEVDLIENFDV